MIEPWMLKSAAVIGALVLFDLALAWACGAIMRFGGKGEGEQWD